MPSGILAEGIPTDRQAELPEAAVVRPPVIGEVVQRRDDRRSTDDRVVGVAERPEHGRRTCLPVVEMQHVHRLAVGAQRLHGRPAVQPEAPGVVGVVARGVAIERGPIVGGRMVHEAQSIAIRRDIDDRQVARAGRCPRIGDPQDRLAQHVLG